jgi:hypothetical protein
MKQKEKELLERIYDCTRTMGTLRPSNPADIRAISHNLKISTEASRELRDAISSLGFGDYQDCAEYLDSAAEILGRRPSAPAHTEDKGEGRAR